VRGTTCEKIIRGLKTAGAKEVHMRVSAPPFVNVCRYGTDINDENKLIANQMNINEICKKLNADSLGYISLEGLKKACKKCVLPLCTACFSRK
jgi:amidophosphoribosyltransferase